MTQEELKRDFYYELRDKFYHKSNPYEDIAEFALNEFVAEFVANKLAICNVSNRTLDEIKPIKWQCRRCKRIIDSKTPHNCDSGFRKRNIIWRPIFFQYGC